VGAPILHQSPVLAAALPIPLAGSSTGPSTGAHEGVARVAVKASIHFPNLTLTTDYPRLKMPHHSGPPASTETFGQEQSDLDDPYVAHVLEDPVAPCRPIPTHSAQTSLAWNQLNYPAPYPSFVALDQLGSSCPLPSRPSLSPPLAGSSTGPSPGAADGVAPESVEAPIHFPSPALTAAPPPLAPLLTDCPTYPLIPVLATAISPTVAHSLAGSSTGPSPVAPEGVALEAVEAPIYFPSPTDFVSPQNAASRRSPCFYGDL